MNSPALLACLLTASLLAACSSQPITRRDGEFGKLIGLQDTLARIIEDKSNRAIRFGVVKVASMVFLPI